MKKLGFKETRAILILEDLEKRAEKIERTEQIYEAIAGLRLPEKLEGQIQAALINMGTILPGAPGYSVDTVMGAIRRVKNLIKSYNGKG